MENDREVFLLTNSVNKTNLQAECINISNEQIFMNFFKIWFIFRKLPKVYVHGKSGHLNSLNLYEYTIFYNDSKYEIYSWATGLLKTKEWIISSNNKNSYDNTQFLNSFSEKCIEYETNYKMLEHKNFNSEDKNVDKILKEIKNEIINVRGILKNF